MSHEHRDASEAEEISVNPMFARSGETKIPRWRIPEGEMLPDSAYQIIHDEILLDGNARQNLATFVTTWMEPQASQLYAEAFDKNMIDRDEYPQTAAIEERCVHILADLWNSPEPHTTIGTSTIGSSEACMLAGLAFKRRWEAGRRAEGKDVASPNIVVSASVQVVWEKFAAYWDVEPRYVPVSKEHPNLSPEGMLGAVDDHTICVVAILGVTYTGDYEPVKELALALDDLQARTGLDVPLHVDGASGAFIAPFLDPELEWDFRLSRVHSINASGHKFGLVYPGLGWVVWAKREYLPDELIFTVSYLGGAMPTLAINFSRPGAQVLLQYYNFLRLGREGYRRVHAACRDSAQRFANEIDAMERVRADLERFHDAARDVDAGRGSAVGPARSLGEAPGARVAGAGVSDAREHAGHDRDAGRVPQRRVDGPHRPAARRHPELHEGPRCPPGAVAADGRAAQRVPPLTHR